MWVQYNGPFPSQARIVNFASGGPYDVGREGVAHMAVPFRPRVLEQLSFATAPALYAALWLCCRHRAGAVHLASYWIAPAVLIAATLLLALLSLLAAPKALRVALLPLACTWLLLGLLLSEIEPGPDPQTQLSLIAEAGGADIRSTVRSPAPPHSPHTIDSAVRQHDAGRTERESRPARLVRGRPSRGRRPARYSLRPCPINPCLRSHCGDQIHAAIAMHLPERYLDPGVWDATAWLRQQGIGVVGALKVSALTVKQSPGRGSFACWLHSMQQAGSQRLIDFAGSSAALPAAAMAAPQPRRCGNAERHDPRRPHLPRSPGPRGL